MMRTIVPLVRNLAIAALLCACGTVPLTGRRQLDLVPSNQIMAMAGYDPHGALDFRQRMASQSEGGQPPEFLSTHPAYQTRMQRIRANLPEAMRYYKP